MEKSVAPALGALGADSTAGTGPEKEGLGSAAGAEGPASPKRGGRDASDEAYLESGNPRPRPRRRRERRPRSPPPRSPLRSGRSPRSVRSVGIGGAASVSADPGLADSAASTASLDSGADSWTS